MTTLDKAALYSFRHPELHRRMHCKVTTVSECGRYACIIVTGWGDEVQEEIANADLTGEFCDKCTASIDEDWLVGIDEVCRENPATAHYC